MSKRLVSTSPHIALFVDRLTTGGVQHSFLGLAEALRDRGCRVDLLIGDSNKRHDHQLPDGVRLMILTSGPTLSNRIADGLGRLNRRWRTGVRHLDQLPRRWRLYAPALKRYLDHEKPDALLSAKTSGNLVAIVAGQESEASTRIVVSERVYLSSSIAEAKKDWKRDSLADLVQALYPLADQVVAISNHVAADLATLSAMKPERITTIHNGLLRPEALDRPAADHPWFNEKIPVILGAGRLSPVKDFPTLIRAFKHLRERRPARLMILGEGEEQADLENLVKSLDLTDDVALMGFTDNPFAFMKAADLFVLSSTFEGFGNVVLEALASGCPVVSTDCPGGVREILDDGRLGRLVPVGDHVGLADAMDAVLSAPPPKPMLTRRAEDFSMERVADRYLRCLVPGYLDQTEPLQ